LDFVGEDGQTIVKLLSDNISMTHLYYEGNYFDMDFVKKLNEQLELNRKIVQYVFSQLAKQEAKSKQDRIENDKR